MTRHADGRYSFRALLMLTFKQKATPLFISYVQQKVCCSCGATAHSLRTASGFFSMPYTPYQTARKHSSALCKALPIEPYLELEPNVYKSFHRSINKTPTQKSRRERETALSQDMRYDIIWKHKALREHTSWDISVDTSAVLFFF